MRLGCCLTPQLDWYENSWMEEFLKHVFSIFDFLGVKLYVIEINPSKSQRNNIKVFSKAIKRLYDAYKNRYNEKVLIFIENRTGQYIQDGEDVNDFWMLFKNRYPNLTRNVGII